MTKKANYIDDRDESMEILVPDWMDTIAKTAHGLGAPAADAAKPPKGLRYRGVFLEAPDGKRRFVYCNRDGALYNTISAKTITLDSVVWTVTGRKGERLSFSAVDALDDAGAAVDGTPAA